MTHTRTWAALGLIAALSLTSDGDAQQMNHGNSSPAMTASDLRVGLNTLLTEHVQLGGAATNAALGGRAAEFDAAAGALDANSVALSNAVGSVYGDEAEAAFLALWRKHIGFIVEYTKAVAMKDRAKAEKAVQDLLGYAKDFGAFLAAANPNLPADVVAELVRGHAGSFKAMIDAQALGDQVAAFAKQREAAAHMSRIADPLAAAIAKQFPNRFAAR